MNSSDTESEDSILFPSVKKETFDPLDLNNETEACDVKLYVKEEPNEKEDFLNDVNTFGPSQYDAIDEKHSVKEEQNQSTNSSIEGNSDLLKNKLDTLKIPVIKLAKLYWCNKCQKNFKTDQSLRIHTKAHMEKSTETDPSDFTTTSCTSPTCKIAFTKFAREVSRMPVGPYECKVCKQTFSLWQNLWKHMRIHEKKESYACNICSENFMNNYDLDNHFRTKCLGEKTHNCKICGKGFLEISWLNCHMVNHTEEKRFECDICGKIFAGRTGLKYHQKTKENPSLKCGICNKKICHRRTLLAHQNSHFYPSRTNEVLKMLNQQTIFKSAAYETYEKETMSSSSKDEIDFQPINFQRGSLKTYERKKNFREKMQNNEIVSIVKTEPESDVQDKEVINFVEEYEELGKLTENDNSISCSLKDESRDSLYVTVSENVFLLPSVKNETSDSLDLNYEIEICDVKVEYLGNSNC